MSAEQVIELDTSTVKSIIDDIIECANLTVETIKETIRNEEEANEEDMDLLIQEIVNEKTTKKIKELEKSRPLLLPPSSFSSSSSSSTAVGRPRKIAKKTGNSISSRTRTRSNLEEEEEEDGNVSDDY